MEVTKTEKYQIVAIVITFILAIAWVIFTPASAAIVTPTPTRTTLFSYGTNYNYSEVVLPDGSYVHQGENISQGRCYDLTGIYGFSGVVAMWDHDWGVGDIEPTVTVRLTHAYRTCIDKRIFPVGRWYQWDGRSCNTNGYCSVGFGNGNNYVFAVVPYIKEIQNETTSANIVVKAGNEQYEIPVTVVNPTPQTPDITPTPDIAVQNLTTIVIPTEIPTITVAETAKDGSMTNISVITPKTPVSVIIPVIALVLMGVFVCRRK